MLSGDEALIWGLGDIWTVGVDLSSEAGIVQCSVFKVQC